MYSIYELVATTLVYMYLLSDKCGICFCMSIKHMLCKHVRDWPISTVSVMFDRGKQSQPLRPSISLAYWWVLAQIHIRIGFADEKVSIPVKMNGTLHKKEITNIIYWQDRQIIGMREKLYITHLIWNMIYLTYLLQF